MNLSESFSHAKYVKIYNFPFYPVDGFGDK